MFSGTMQSLSKEVGIFQLIIVSLRRKVEYYSVLKKENSTAQCNKDEAWEVVLREGAQKKNSV